MLILKTQKDVDNQVNILKGKGKSIGFVPTMGALHEGHLSLIKKSNRTNDITVCSIFVNPTQFNDKSDFEKYPATIEKDIEMLISVKCDILFLPSVNEMYPKGFGIPDKPDFGYLATTLEGEFRPGHFDGMAQIVEKLLRTVNPDYLYMGQKDFQQAMIVRQLIKIRKLKTELVVCPIVREKDGLAMSSRNVRLDKASRTLALELSKTLNYLKRIIRQDTGEDAKTILEKAEARMAKFPAIQLEYIAWRNASTLKPVTKYNPEAEQVLLIAAFVGGVRLIDNMLVNPKS
jgi:pantoate--beta-alanine ligase